MRKISDEIVNILAEQNVKYIFGYIGGAITHIVDSIAKRNDISFVQVYHEQSAAIAAEGYARSTNDIGVAIATSGPGATNLITGIADAYFDSIPVLYITGQVNTYEFKYDKPIRQQGFQEMDIISMVKPITKYAKLLDEPNKVIDELYKALRIAKSGRPGPVLLDIPMDIQRTMVNTNISGKKTGSYIRDDYVDSDKTQIEEILLMLSKAKRPMFLLGGGIKNIPDDIKSLLLRYLIENKIPVVCSLLGKGAIPEDKINYMGMIGSYGNRCANMSLYNVDYLLVLGSRLDTRQTGAQYNDFLSNGKIIHVDIDEDELLYHRLSNKYNLNVNLSLFIKKLIDKVPRYCIEDKWVKHLNRLKEKYNQTEEIRNPDINADPYLLMQYLNKYAERDSIFVADVGQNQMWSAQTLRIKENQKFFTTGGHAPMGFAIPFSVGLSFANREKIVFSITGDGGFHIATQSLMLISQYNLPIKIIVINNFSLGMITQFQSLYFSGKMAGTVRSSGYQVPSIKQMAASYNLNYLRIKKIDFDNGSLVDNIFTDFNPTIIEYQVNGITTVNPKLEYNQPIYNTSPYLCEEELKSALDY